MQRAYRGLSKYNYYRLKHDIDDYRNGKHYPAGTKMLYWAEASHSQQHIQTTYFYATVNPEHGPMVRKKIAVPLVASTADVPYPGHWRPWWLLDDSNVGQHLRRRRTIKRVVRVRICLRPDLAHVEDSEVRSEVLRGRL